MATLPNVIRILTNREGAQNDVVERLQSSTAADQVTIDNQHIPNHVTFDDFTAGVGFNVTSTGSGDSVVRTISAEVQVGEVHLYDTNTARNAATDVIWHRGDLAVVGAGNNPRVTYVYTGTDQTTEGVTVDGDWELVADSTGASVTVGTTLIPQNVHTWDVDYISGPLRRNSATEWNFNGNAVTFVANATPFVTGWNSAVNTPFPSPLSSTVTATRTTTVPITFGNGGPILATGSTFAFDGSQQTFTITPATGSTANADWTSATHGRASWYVNEQIVGLDINDGGTTMGYQFPSTVSNITSQLNRFRREVTIPAGTGDWTSDPLPANTGWTSFAGAAAIGTTYPNPVDFFSEGLILLEGDDYETDVVANLRVFSAPSGNNANLTLVHQITNSGTATAEKLEQIAPFFDTVGVANPGSGTAFTTVNEVTVVQGNTTITIAAGTSMTWTDPGSHTTTSTLTGPNGTWSGMDAGAFTVTSQWDRENLVLTVDSADRPEAPPPPVDYTETVVELDASAPSDVWFISRTTSGFQDRFSDEDNFDGALIESFGAVSSGGHIGIFRNAILNNFDHTSNVLNEEVRIYPGTDTTTGQYLRLPAGAAVNTLTATSNNVGAIGSDNGIDWQYVGITPGRTNRQGTITFTNVPDSIFVRDVSRLRFLSNGLFGLTGIGGGPSAARALVNYIRDNFDTTDAVFQTATDRTNQGGADRAVTLNEEVRVYPNLDASGDNYLRIPVGATIQRTSDDTPNNQYNVSSVSTVPLEFVGTSTGTTEFDQISFQRFLDPGDQVVTLEASYRTFT